MITIVTYIKQVSDPSYIERKRTIYGHAYRFIYVHAEEIADPIFISKTRKRFNLTDHEYDSIVSEVSANKSAENTRKKKKSTTQKRLVAHVAAEKKNIGKKITATKKKVRVTRREIFKGNQKIQRQSIELKNKTVFGSRKLLQQISHLSNVVNNTETPDEERISAVGLREAALTQYKEQRKGNIYVLGESNQKGNRFFNFDLPNSKITYKPAAKTKVVFDVMIPKKFKDELNLLQAFIDAKDIPVTVTVTKNTVNLTFNNERLNGFAVDKKSRTKELTAVKKQKLPEPLNTETIYKVYHKYHEQRRQKLLEGKISGRVIAVDMNPTTLGYSITDNGRIISCGTYDFSGLHVKTGKSSDSLESKYAVNKRCYEKHCVVKELFKTAKHFKCAVFALEDLNFKEETKSKGKNFNYETKVVWNRTLLDAAITKRCENEGIELKRVKPAYSSFIGNIMYEVYDPVAASIEIGRRHIYSKDKLGFPLITDTITDTVRSLRDSDGNTVSDVLLIKDGSLGETDGRITWQSLFYVSNGFGFTDSDHRARRAIDVGLQQSFSVKNYKSKVVHSTYRVGL